MLRRLLARFLPAHDAYIPNSDTSFGTNDAFISGSPADARWLYDELLPRLHKAGLRTDISVQSMELAPHQLPIVEQRVRQARHVIALLSPDSLVSSKARFERDLAQTLDLEEETYRLIPVRLSTLGDTPLPPRLAQLIAVDFTNIAQAERAFTLLIKAVGGPRLTLAAAQAQAAARACPYPDPRIAATTFEPTALREAIRRSAEDQGIYVEAALVERLVTEVCYLLDQAQPSTTPDEVRMWLQQTLALLWERTERRFMALRAYELLIQQGVAPLARAVAQQATER